MLVQRDLSKTIKQMRDDGDFLEVNAFNIHFGRTNNKYTRSTILGDQLIVDTTERIISVGATTLGFSLSYPATARILSFASTSANDTGAGTGGRTINVNGLDANHCNQSETITLTGQTEVDTVNQYLRINTFALGSSGSSNWNEGVIYCSDNTDTFTAGVPQTRCYKTMPIGYSHSGTSLFTLQKGHSMAFKHLLASTDISGANNRMILKFKRTFGKAGGNNTFYTTETFYLDRTTQIDISWFSAMRAEDDLQITAQMNSGAAAVSVKLTVVIYDD